MLRPFGGISKPNGYVGVETSPSSDLAGSAGGDDSLDDGDDAPPKDTDGEPEKYDDDDEEAEVEVIAPVVDFFRDAQEQQAGEEEDCILNVQVSDKVTLHRIKDMPGFKDPPWITASQAKRLIWSPHYNTTPGKSADRMRRVQGMTKWSERKTAEGVGLEEESIFDNISVHIDPILIMVRHAVSGVTMVLAMPQSFSTVKHGRNRRRLKLSMLARAWHHGHCETLDSFSRTQLRRCYSVSASGHGGNHQGIRVAMCAVSSRYKLRRGRQADLECEDRDLEYHVKSSLRRAPHGWR
eukprot:Tamp_18921.p1 GENE.Tamp_18921~~Tamp_18921.p1  ORF type:complete len:295 (+),score=41.72 Tamp_18921:167-1051(+)